MPALLSDEELVAQVRDADDTVARAAFSALFAKYWVALCEWGYYFTRDRSVAEEFVADVLADLWQRRREWHPTTTVEAYLFGAVRNRVRSEMRNVGRHESITEQFVSAGHVPAMGTPINPPDAAVQSNDLRRQLDQAMDSLSGRARAAVMYRWYDGLSFAEIATRLGVSEVAVRILITRAFKTLRMRLPNTE